MSDKCQLGLSLTASVHEGLPGRGGGGGGGATAQRGYCRASVSPGSMATLGEPLHALSTVFNVEEGGGATE